jgi:hypothetical protein
MKFHNSQPEIFITSPALSIVSSLATTLKLPFSPISFISNHASLFESSFASSVSAKTHSTMSLLSST